MTFVRSLLTLAFVIAPAIAAADDGLRFSTDSITLRGPFARHQLVVIGESAGAGRDVTRDVKFTIEPAHLAAVSDTGSLKPTADGEGTITATLGTQTARAALKVVGVQSTPAVDFERDVMPVLTRFGCNSGPCHGKARGQNGFQLSLLGFDPQFDYDSLTKEARGRRVFLPDPAQSLLLTKPAGVVPHGGGRRLGPQDAGYVILERWIRGGLPRSVANVPQLTRVRVEPADRILPANATQQLRVLAEYSDGTAEDVTHLAAFQSNESGIAAVNETGLIRTSTVVGEAAVMARYRGEIALCTITVPRSEPVPPELYAKLPRYSEIDGHVWARLQRLGIVPSEPCNDATFVRRATIDIIGRAPTAEEARAFLADTSANKRAALVDRLLEEPEFAEHWANKWADLLRPNAYRVGIKSVLSFDTWIRDSFRKNKPYDQFVRELLTAQGSTFHNGAVVLFRDRRAPDELATITSQLFLGIRLECAKCHQHPFEVWGQKHFYSYAAYFAKIGRKGTGLSPPISGSEEIVFTGAKGQVTHPVTGEVLEPKPLFGSAPDVAEGSDPREALAAWVTSDDNPFFARVMVNRVWADLMGRGIVEPVDDLRATNPPSNEPLLAALAEDFRAQKYDLKKLIREIATSYVYGLSSIPNETNVADTQNYSRHYRQRLRAEVLLDSVVQITGISDSFEAMPPESQAKEIWSHRIGSLFLDAFGRPDPNQDPPCERTTDTSVVQTLHLMNAENLHRKVTSDVGLPAQLASSKKSPNEIVEEIYLAVYARHPDFEEQAIGRELFEKAGENRRRAAEDLLWALMNTPEFLFKD